MKKQELLLKEMGVFRSLLIEAARVDSLAEFLLKELTPLFEDIEVSNVSPPCVDRYPRYFHSDNQKFGAGSPMEEASANFRSALEDWRSKPWYPK